MGWTKRVWRGGLSRILFELGHIHFQKKAWNAEIPNYVSFYEELLCGLGDMAIPDHLHDFHEQCFCNRDELNALIRIDNLTTKFVNLDIQDNEQIWASEFWMEIEKEAKEIFYESFLADFLNEIEPADQRFKPYLEKSND